MHFRLAGDGENQRIVQFLNWTMNAPPGRSMIIQVSPQDEKKEPPVVVPSFHGRSGETCMHFRLAGDGENQRIVQFLNWTMNAPPGRSMIIQVSPQDEKKEPPVVVPSFHGRSGET